MREISNVRAFGRHTEPRHVKDLANEVDTMGGASYSDVKHIISASTQLTSLEALPELQLLSFLGHQQTVQAVSTVQKCWAFGFAAPDEVLIWSS